MNESSSQSMSLASGMGHSNDFDDSDDASEFARVNRVLLSKDSEEYRLRRERNNAAVKRSRHKSKQKNLETQKRVDQLRNENNVLEKRVEALTRELCFMKQIFVPRSKNECIDMNNHENNKPTSP